MSNETKIQATAQVSVTLSVTLSQPWGADWTIGKIHENAARDAIAVVRQAMKPERALQIIGEPVVRAIITEKAP